MGKARQANIIPIWLAAVLAVCDADGAPALVLRSARPSFLMTICLPSFVR